MVIAAVVVGLIPRIAYVALVLPSRFGARDWATVWVGFDIVLLIVLAHAAWAMWFCRQIMVATALVAGTPFLCDAWFDVMTSFGSRGEWVTLTTAIGGELPAALGLFWIARRGMRQTVRAFHELSGAAGPPPRLRDAGLLSATTFRTVPPQERSPGRSEKEPQGKRARPSGSADG